MNILVTGANGQLGRELRRVSAGSRDNYVFTDVTEIPGAGTVMLDVTRRDDVERLIMERDIKIVINCVAYTNVDRAEDDRECAERLNSGAVYNLAGAIGRNGGMLVHISTDYVFGGNPCNTPCREDEPACPAGVYGQTKLQGEEALLRAGCRYLIFRTAWLYSEYGKNFLRTMLMLTAGKKELNVVFDQVGTPTYAYDLAEAIFRIIEDRKYEGHDGVYHYSNEGVCSWFDFAKMIAEYSGNTRCDIRPCHSDEFPSKVRRPSYSVLDKTKFKNTFGIRIPYWTDSLKRCIESINSMEQP